MMRSLSTLALCGAFVFAAASPPAIAAAEPKAKLKVVVAVKNGTTKTDWLYCNPDGGTHPAAKAACGLLRKAKGDPAKVNVNPRPVCTKELTPHAVVVAGMWRGKPVRYATIFGNECLMKARTGALLSL
ncbi:hypothetical protein HII36_03995 [Nonomuraea sp. NN258]|uniref:SSI family serine proteinase inhibitor n=1 Tax=Nonomuraea antri TaxID=2730852 RepID=UPI001567DC0F|nr:SSI family serine proteinase inhibitor [Nonomuraea antri]NRQ30996.1 hypothetical protein [Nonomuraea antri]